MSSETNNIDKNKLLNDQQVDEQEYLSIYNRLNLLLNVSSNKITKHNLVKLLSQTYPEEEEEEIKNEIAKKLIFKFSKGESNEISIQDFIYEIINRKKLLSSHDEFSLFFDNLISSFSTKSERIIFRLKKLLTKEWVKKSKELVDLLSTIIVTITEGDLYELDTADFKSELMKKEEKKENVPTNNLIKKDKVNSNGLGFLAVYSNVENLAQKESDIQVIRRVSKKFITPFNFSSVHSSASEEKSQKRREVDLNSIISPSILARIHSQLNNIDTIFFDIFDLNEIVGKKTSIFLAHEILSKFEIIEKEIIPQEILNNFIEEIVQHYDRKNALYHNDLHAADVMQTLFTIFIKGDLQEKMQLNQLDTFAVTIAAFCHDYKHTGQNNLFHINSKSKIAMRYNDTSVLENYHVAQTFKVLAKSRTNIYKNFTPEEFRICRRRMIESILVTDMANHQSVLTNMKAKIASFNIVKGNNFKEIFKVGDISKLFEAQQNLLNMVIHSADISNPAKPDKISANWTKMVYDEFFFQGDLEKKLGLPVSNFCDRNTTNIDKAMIGFINFVVLPTFEILSTLIWEAVEYRDHCKANLKKHMNNVKKAEKKKLIEKNSNKK